LAQYKIGTVSVTNGSNTVTGQATVWSTNAAVGYTFKIKDEDAIYNIASIVSDTQITLTVNYAGTTKSNQEYQITRDFTPNLSLPEIWAGDIDWPFHLTDTIRKIDTNFAQNVSQNASPTFAGLTISGLSASVPVITDANKALASLAYTGAASFRKNLSLETDDTPTFAGAKLGVSGSRDSDGDSYITVEKTADIDEEQLYLNGVLVRETFISGITSLPKQSGFRATRKTAQSLSTGTGTKIQYDTEEYDIQGEYDNVTNFRFTATKAGIYAISASVFTDAMAWDAGEVFIIQLYKNDALVAEGYRSFAQAAQTSAYLPSTICDQRYLAAGDYLEIFVYHDQGAAIDSYADGTYNFFSVTKIA